MPAMKPDELVEVERFERSRAVLAALGITIVIAMLGFLMIHFGM